MYTISPVLQVRAESSEEDFEVFATWQGRVLLLSIDLVS